MSELLNERANNARMDERKGIKYFAELGVMYHDNIALITAQQAQIESLTAQLEEAKENQRIAIEALECINTTEYYIDTTKLNLYENKAEDCFNLFKHIKFIAEQALSTIRGK